MDKPGPSSIQLPRAVHEGSARERAAAVVEVYGAIFRRLSPLVGAAGVRALFNRSVTLSATECPCLKSALVTPESAELLERSLQDQAPDRVSEIAVKVFGTFFTLLANFIGARLAKQVLEGVCSEPGGSSEWKK